LKVKRQVFGIESAEVRHLSQADKRLASVIQSIGDMTYNIHTNGFSFVIETIIGQMLSVKAADAIKVRFYDVCYGELFFTTITLSESVFRINRHGDDGRTWFQDAWIFEHDCSLDDVHFQENETCDAMWASADKIREMITSGEFLSEWFYPYLNEMLEKWS